MDVLLRERDHAAGQRRFSDLTRQLVVQARPDLAERLPFEDDGVFLDPLLFAYFSLPDPLPTLDQLLVGRMPRDLRPDAVPVRADDEGIIDVPGIGTLRTERPRAALTFRRGPRLFHGETPVPYRMTVEAARTDRAIRITSHIPSLYRSLFAEPGGAEVSVTPDATPVRRTELLAALDLMEHVYPEYHTLVRESTRQIVLFQSERINSFAAPPAHGCAFVNTAYGNGPVFLFEDLLHQCGHIVFTGMTLDKQSLFRVPPDTRLAQDDPSGEVRTAYVVLHAIYTERLMAEGLWRALERHALTDEQRHEALGRLAYVLRRYHADLGELLSANVLHGPGTALGAKLAGEFTRLLRVATPELRGIDTSGQPYNFSYKVFRTRNPVRCPAKTADEQSAA